jgi:hypothetical protein
MPIVVIWNSFATLRTSFSKGNFRAASAVEVCGIYAQSPKTPRSDALRTRAEADRRAFRLWICSCSAPRGDIDRINRSRHPAAVRNGRPAVEVTDKANCLIHREAMRWRPVRSMSSNRPRQLTDLAPTQSSHFEFFGD